MHNKYRSFSHVYAVNRSREKVHFSHNHRAIYLLTLIQIGQATRKLFFFPSLYSPMKQCFSLCWLSPCANWLLQFQDHAFRENVRFMSQRAENIIRTKFLIIFSIKTVSLPSKPVLVVFLFVSQLACRCLWIKTIRFFSISLTLHSNKSQ